jgi:hypothetical protein
MTFLEDLKKTKEKMTGWRRPNAAQLAGTPRAGKVSAFRFKGLGRHLVRWRLRLPALSFAHSCGDGRGAQKRHGELRRQKRRTIQLTAGHAAILAAGTGHQCISASKTFLVVGAYPPRGIYDECIPARAQHARNAAQVRKVARPQRIACSGTKIPCSSIGKRCQIKRISSELFCPFGGPWRVRLRQPACSS